MKYVLNPIYFLINDIKRIVICSNETDHISYIHPLHAIILTYFDKDDDITLEQKISKISKDLVISQSELTEFINKLLNNDNKVWIGDNKSNFCQFPEQTLIKKEINYKTRNYKIRDFLIGNETFDNLSLRLNKPIEFTFVINTDCITDCIYCYANRKYDYKKNQLSISRIREIITEAKSLSIKKIDITGGEFFLHKNWVKILETLVYNNYYPEISTKIPLKEDTIRILADMNVKRIQFSLDALDEKILQKKLQINKKNYLNSIKKTLKYCENHNLDFKVNTIITKYNCSYSIINDIIEYLLGNNNFKLITIGFAGYSINNCLKKYRDNVIPKKEDAILCLSLIKNKYSKNEKVIIGDIDSFEDNFRYEEKDFFNKAICTGNIQQFYLLPDGKVTLCEELYWHPKFLLGDLSKQSIMEMWNSKEAVSFYNIQKEKFKKDSACKTCDKFDYCHLNASVCWKEVMESYGKDKWYYPDPRCPKAPYPNFNKYI